MAKSKERKTPIATEVAVVEIAQVEASAELNADQSIEDVVESYTPPEPTKFEKQLGITTESFMREYSPSVDLKVRFASIMELMQNYHMSCESKNDARYKDIMNHILTSCELASTFVK
jgi:hypothetical protein